MNNVKNLRAKVTETIVKNVKVTVHIHDKTVRDKVQRINRIYDILSPKRNKNFSQKFAKTT
jgi:hypothetical protein